MTQKSWYDSSGIPLYQGLLKDYDQNIGFIHGLTGRLDWEGPISKLNLEGVDFTICWQLDSCCSWFLTMCVSPVSSSYPTWEKASGRVGGKEREERENEKDGSHNVLSSNLKSHISSLLPYSIWWKQVTWFSPHLKGGFYTGYKYQEVGIAGNYFRNNMPQASKAVVVSPFISWHT